MPAPCPRSANGRPRTPEASHDLLTRVRSANTDATLFPLLAELAREAGRTDLADEFASRATRAAPVTKADAERRQKDACKLVNAGKLAEAENAFREAIRLDPTLADAHGNLGVTLARLERLAEAEAAFRVAIRLAPSVVTMYVNLATCLLNQGRQSDCEEWARQALQLDASVAEAHRLLGCSLEARGRLEPAEAALAEAVTCDPRLAEAHYRRGLVLVRLKRKDEAEASYRAAVNHKPAYVAAWAALGSLLEHEDRPTEAVDCAREAVKHEPKIADWHNNLGVALAACEKTAEAESAYREALRLDPKMASAHSNLGNALRSLDKPEEAEASLREALRLKSDYAEAHNNIGIVLVQLGRCEEGIQHYHEAIRLKPDYPEAHMNLSLSLLGAGDYTRGWKEYEWRWKVRNVKPPAIDVPRWDGSALEGRTVLLTAEQGLGDTLNFLRYAPLVKAKGGTVVLDCQVPIASLAATCPGVDTVVPRGKGLPRIDCQVPLLSLPAIFGVPPEASTATVPYLTPTAERVTYWKKDLAAVPGFKVGIAWQGSKVHKGDKLRSVRLTRFAPLAALPGVTLCSLQKGAGIEQLEESAAAAMNVRDYGARTAADMDDVAALIPSLDLLVSVDTALAHLAGAMGCPVWVLIPFAADWRWLREGDSTVWYPSMRLFRQSTRGDWDSVFGRIAAAIAGAARAKAEG